MPFEGISKESDVEVEKEDWAGVREELGKAALRDGRCDGGFATCCEVSLVEEARTTNVADELEGAAGVTAKQGALGKSGSWGGGSARSCKRTTVHC